MTPGTLTVPLSFLLILCYVCCCNGNLEMPYPQFFLQPTQKSVKREVFTALQCGAYGGIGELSYAFYTGQSPHRNMMQLVKRATAENSTKIAEYRILKVESSHKGYYQCVVTDQARVSIYSDVVYLTVVDNYISHVNITTESAVLHTTTKLHILPCTMPDSAPPAWPKWYRDEEPIDPEDAHMFVSYGSGTIEGTQITFGDLVLYGVDASHKGLYQCSALNKVLKDVQINIKLYNVSIIDIGSIGSFTSTEVITSDHTTSVGEDSFIFCAGIGSPSPRTSFLLVKPNFTSDKAAKDKRLLMVPGSATGKESEYFSTCQVGDSYYSATLTVRAQAGSKTSSVNFTDTDISPVVYYLGQDNPPVSLSCQTNSQTAKQWFINGVAWNKQAYHDIDLSGSFDLTANDVRDEDSGVYQCKSFNDHLTVYRTQVLCVVDKLKIETNSPAIVVHEGLSQKLECTVYGSPTPYMQWSYNEDKVWDSAGNVIRTDFTSIPSTTVLELTNVSLSDEGLYNCKAWNRIPEYNGRPAWSDEDQKEIKLTVVASVKVFSPQSHVLTFGGDSQTLECWTYGKPTPTLPVWYFEEALLSNSSMYTITYGLEEYGHRSFINIASMSLEREGNYSCKSTNVVEGVKRGASVTISVPVISPVVVTGAAVVELEHGVYESVECRALGKPEATSMTWVWSNASLVKTLLPENNDIVTVAENGTLVSTLSLTLESSAEAGNYTCISSNSYQDNIYTHNFTTLARYVRRVSVVAAETALTGIFNEPVVLRCSVSGLPLPSDILWESQGQPIRDSGGIVIKTVHQGSSLVSTLEIVHVNYDSEGDYNCNASNYYKGAEHEGSATIDLVIENPVTTTPTALYAYNRIGKELSVSCDVEGKPLPDDIIWYFSGVPGQMVTNGEQYSTQLVSHGNVVTGTLTINRLALTLLGDYTCTATNTVQGAVRSSEAVINVANIQSVIVRAEISMVKVSKRNEARLQCIGTGVPPPDSIKWSYRGVQLPRYSLKYLVELNSSRIYNMNSTLRIANVNVSDEGVYTCSFSNSDITGSIYHDYATISLTVEVPVEVSLSAKELELYDGEEARITCTAYGRPEPFSVEWIVPSTGQILKTDDSFNITPATRGNDYTSILTVNSMHLNLERVYECRAENKVLGANITTPGYVSLLRVENVAIRADQRAVSGLVGHVAKMSCTAQGVMKPSEIRWFKDKHELSVTNERYIISQTPFYNNSRGLYTKMESQLTVKIVKWGDRGRYNCKSTNQNKNTTHEAESTVLMNIGEAVTIRDTTETVQVLIGEETGLISVAVGGFPLPTTTWLKDGLPLTLPYTTHDIKVEEYLHIVQLKFSTVGTEHAGNYTIVTTNSVFNTSYTAQLDILVLVGYKPSVSFSSNIGYLPDTNIIDVNQGQVNKVTCLVRASPYPSSVTWLYNASDIMTSPLYNTKYSVEDMYLDTSVEPSLVQRVLIVKQAQLADSGEYQCTASNYIDEVMYSDSKEVFIRVVSSVVLSTHNVTYEAKLGQELNITCFAQGYPLPKDIVWFHNGSVLRQPPDTANIIQDQLSFNKKLSTLWLSNVKSSDLGGYECRSSNIVLGRQRTGVQKFEILEAIVEQVSQPLTQNELIIAVVLAVIILIAIVIVALIIVWKKRRRKPTKGYSTVIEPGSGAASTLAADRDRMDLIQIGSSAARPNMFSSEVEYAELDPGVFRTHQFKPMPRKHRVEYATIDFDNTGNQGADA